MNEISTNHNNSLKRVLLCSTYCFTFIPLLIHVYLIFSYVSTDLPPILVPRSLAVEEPSIIDIQQHQFELSPENTPAARSQAPPNTLLASSPYTPMDSPTTPPGYLSEDGDNNENLSNTEFYNVIRR